ncbi:MAG: MFS transporter [Deltaproteobacteria bacterium]|nr:MFS transporter [Deltaproteobacteria bacterium]
MEKTASPIPFGKQLQVFLPFALGYFLSYLYRVINAVLAPDLAADLGVDPSGLGLLTATYFITFAAFQLPLGILLDRFGPRRIEAALLILAATGAFVFAGADTLTGLIIGRGLIGFGVSACLMAAFKAFVIWFPKQQLPRINGFQMAAGGLGALAATSPVESALTVTDWRGVFTLLAALTAIVAAIIFFIVPERQISHKDESFVAQMRDMGTILTSLNFWRIAPWATLSQGTFLAVHGLWAGPWLRDVAGYDRSTVAGTLLLLAGAMVVGFIVLGTAAERLNRWGISTAAVGAAGMGIFMVVMVIITLGHKSGATWIWILFGFFGTSGILPYAALSQSFPLHLSGRVNTTLNLLVFLAAFIAQWGIGAIIGQWPTTQSGGYAPAGYQAAFGTLLVIQLITILWFWFASALFRKTIPKGRDYEADAAEANTPDEKIYE